MTTTTFEPGCYLDGSRGHYLTHDAIEFGVEQGYILGSFEAFAVSRYATECGADDYPFEALVELCDDVIAWLNVGENSGKDRPMKGQNQPPAIPDDCAWGFEDGDFGLWRYDADGLVELCDDVIAWLNVGENSGKDRPIKGQNQPPAIPDDCAWGFEDGDFGLWRYDADGLVE